MSKTAPRILRHTMIGSSSIGEARMPYAQNALDAALVYFEDDGGEGAPVVILGGFLDPVDLVRRSPIASALQPLAEEFRLVFIDHRGHGRSGMQVCPGPEKPICQVASTISWIPDGRFDLLNVASPITMGLLGWLRKIGETTGSEPAREVMKARSALASKFVASVGGGATAIHVLCTAGGVT